MSNNPDPTTTQIPQLNTSFVPPHATAHEENGGDPIVPQIRLVGSLVTLTAATATSTTPVKTSLSITGFTRGGDILVEASGQRLINRSGGGVDGYIDIMLYVDGVIHEVFREGLADVGLTAPQYQSSGSVRFFIPAPNNATKIGPHTFDIYIAAVKSGAGGISVYFPAGIAAGIGGITALMTVVELNPEARR
jgi:hypothetical protein